MSMPLIQEKTSTSATTKAVKKIKIISKKKSQPPVDLSFDEWLLLGKKMGYESRAEAMPPIMVDTYFQDNSQIERHADFIRKMTQVENKVSEVLDEMKTSNREFKTEEKTKIFDDQVFASVEVLRGIVMYYKSGAIEYKKKLLDEKAHLIYQRYKDDASFKNKVNEWIKENE